MTKIRTGTAVLLGAVGLSVIASLLPAAAPAHADTTTSCEAQYLNDLVQIGAGPRTGASYTNLVNDGYGIRSAIANGVTPHTAAAVLYENSNSHGSNGITMNQANAIVQSAISDLC